MRLPPAQAGCAWTRLGPLACPAPLISLLCSHRWSRQQPFVASLTCSALWTPGSEFPRVLSIRSPPLRRCVSSTPHQTVPAPSLVTNCVALLRHVALGSDSTPSSRDPPNSNPAFSLHPVSFRMPSPLSREPPPQPVRPARGRSAHLSLCFSHS